MRTTAIDPILVADQQRVGGRTHRGQSPERNSVVKRERFAAFTRPARRLRLCAGCLAASLLIETAARSMAQGVSGLIPAASMAVSGNELSAVRNPWDQNYNSDSSPKALDTADGAFFSDPPATYWPGSIYSVTPVTYTDPLQAARQAFLTMFENSGAPGPPAPGSGFPTWVPLGGITNAAGTVEAMVLGAPTNAVYLTVPCYWDGIGSGETVNSHFHFEVRVEAAANGNASTTTTGGVTLPAAGGTVQVPVTSTAAMQTTLLNTSITVGGYEVILDSIDSPTQITVLNNIAANSNTNVPGGAAVFFAASAFAPLTNATLDVYAATNDWSGLQPPGQSTVITASADPNNPWDFSAPPGIPEPTILFPVNPSSPASWHGYPWVVSVLLPYPKTALRVGVYAAIYTTGHDESLTGSYAGLWQEFPNPWYYAGKFIPDPMQWGELDYTQAMGVVLTNGPVYDPLGVGTITNEPGDAHLWDYSPPFTVAIPPTSVQTAKFMPYTIIYAPPGNGSTAGFQTASSFSTSFSLQFGQASQSTLANVQGSDFHFDGEGSLKFGDTGIKLSLGGQDAQSSQFSLVDTVQDSQGTTETYANGMTSSAGIQGYGAGGKPASYSLPPGDQGLSTWDEPFWYDLIDVILDPAFAFWVSPAPGGSANEPVAISASQIIGFADNPPVHAQLRVRDLYCSVLGRTGYTINKPDGSTLTLTPDDCESLLQLDPFFALGQSQAAPLDSHPERFVPCYGQAGSTAPVTYIQSISDWEQRMTSEQASKGYGTQTATNGSSSSSISVSLSQMGGFGGGSSYANSQQNSVTMSFGSQQAASAQYATTASVSLVDSGGFPQGFRIYWDSLFGSICVQDAAEPGPQTNSGGFVRPPFCGATITWTNAADGDWTNAANWSPNQVPGPLDDAVISGGGVTLPAAAVAYSLTLSGGALVGPGSLALTNGPLLWSGGTIQTVVECDGGTLANALHLDGGHLINHGTLNWTNADVEDDHDAIIDNMPGATINLVVDGTGTSHQNGMEGLFSNAGNLNVWAGPNPAFIADLFNNRSGGMVSVKSGTLDFLNSVIMDPAGNLNVGLNRSSGYGQIAFSGNVALNGAFGVQLDDGFIPWAGEPFTVLSYAGYSGAFINFSLPASVVWQTDLNNTALTLTAAQSVGQPAIWTAATNVPSGEFNAVAASPGLFVAVGGAGAVVTSTDAITWTTPTNYVEMGNNLNAVTYGGGKFVAVGDNGWGVTSADGFAWSASGSITSTNLHGIAYGAGRFVAVGDGGVIITSPDGLTWTPASYTGGTADTADDLTGLAFGNRQFVALGFDQDVSFRSADGITWTQGGAGLNGDQWSGVAYGNGVWVAAGAAGMASSTDGNGWVARANPHAYLVAVAYGNGLFLAANYDGELFVSAGTNYWTRYYPSGDVSGLAYGNGVYLEVGDNGIMTAPQAAINPAPVPITWTPGSYGSGASDTNDDLSGIAYGKDQFAAVGFDGETAFLSTNGTTWTQGGSGLDDDQYTGVAYGSNGVFVAVDGRGGLSSSTDANNWTVETKVGAWLSGIAWLDGTYVAAGWQPSGAESPAPVFTSPTGLNNWSAHSSGLQANLDAIAAAAPLNELVAVADDGAIIVSKDLGATWSLADSTAANGKPLNGVTYGGGHYVAVGDSGALVTSSDGVTWTQPTNYLGTDNDLNAVAYDSGMYVAVGEHGWTAISTDATNWTSLSSATVQNLYGIARNDGVFVAVGDNGTILANVVSSTQAPPMLHISRSENGVELYWPAVPAWNLEQNSSLSSPAGWMTSSGVATTNGTNYLNLAKPTGQQFYRLFKP